MNTKGINFSWPASVNKHMSFQQACYHLLELC